VLVRWCLRSARELCATLQIERTTSENIAGVVVDMNHTDVYDRKKPTNPDTNGTPTSTAVSPDTTAEYMLLASPFITEYAASIGLRLVSPSDNCVRWVFNK